MTIFYLVAYNEDLQPQIYSHTYEKQFSHFGTTFVAHKPFDMFNNGLNEGYFISHKESGMRIGLICDKRINAAINKTIALLESKGIEKTMSAIQRSIDFKNKLQTS